MIKPPELATDCLALKIGTGNAGGELSRGFRTLDGARCRKMARWLDRLFIPDMRMPGRRKTQDFSLPGVLTNVQDEKTVDEFAKPLSLLETVGTFTSLFTSGTGAPEHE